MLHHKIKATEWRKKIIYSNK